MNWDSAGLVFDLPPITIPTTVTQEAIPWIAAATLLVLIILLRYKPWRNFRRRFNLFRRTEKPLLKMIGWVSVLISPLWLALIALVFFSLWKLTTSFGDAIGVESMRWHVLAIVGMIAALGGLLATPLMIMNAFHAERRTRAGEESYLTDRIAQAVEKLGSERVVWREGKQNSEPNIEVRMGALYLLERIAKDSPRDHIPITETICAYIRENAAQPNIDYDATHEKELAIAKRQKIKFSELDANDRDACLTYAVPRADVQAAMTVLGRRPADAIDYEVNNKYVLDLRGAHLDRADLTGGNFANAVMDQVSLRGAALCLADFKGARLKEADLHGADLFKANLQEAWLSGAKFANAWLDWANLHGSQLSLAKFQGANFSATETSFAAVKNADFTDAKHLDEGQLAAMVGDGSTILPMNARAPRSETWTDRVLPSETFFSLWRTAKRQAGVI
ncbi:MAG: pentapeptide repeat-containing protein [Rhodobacteraceae bacterium]|nr:pentapeptide repeat-containing protein [Paracoccaceae bacterium]